MVSQHCILSFVPFIRALGRTVPYLSIVTNGQWKNPEEVIRVLLDDPVSMVEISVGGDSKWKVMRDLVWVECLRGCLRT